MSYAIEVFVPAVADDLASRWPAAPAAHGLAVEVYPGFRPSTWRGGLLPLKLAVRPGSFTAWERYGTEAIVAGFECDTAPVNEEFLAELASEAAPELVEALRNAKVSVVLRTSMGRSVADLRAQCFAAAALAALSGGVVVDGQSGGLFAGDAAFANAEREADAYERTAQRPEDWWLVPFPGWAALEPPVNEGGPRGA